MKNWKTTLSGVIAALGFILPQFGIASELSQAIQTVAIAAFAWFAKDKNVSGSN